MKVLLIGVYNICVVFVFEPRPVMVVLFLLEQLCLGDYELDLVVSQLTAQV